jgi:SulP family sulfate permease
LIIASGINFIDVTGAEMLTQEAQRLRSRGGALYLCGLKGTARETLRRGGYINVIGQENLFSSKEEAIRLIFQRLDKDCCALCQRRIFRECATVEFTGTGYSK